MADDKKYYKAFASDGGWRFKVYHYFPDGDREIEIHRSDKTYPNQFAAIDAACDWCEKNDIEAEWYDGDWLCD